MDKIIWLSVIREELGLLNSLATGMIDDADLTREEVMLAISRSKIVVSEFEMLLNNLPTPDFQEKRDEGQGTKAESEAVTPVPATIPEVPETEEIELLTEEENVSSQPVQPEESLSHPLSPSPGHPVTPSPPPLFSRPEKEEQPVLNLEESKEEFTQYKAAPLKSLKEGLSLNDRYLFQRELFNNDKSRLEETVSALDHLTNIREAVDYLKANFRWDKSEASEKFVQLVKRRFS